jgi:hypothetical protein
VILMLSELGRSYPVEAVPDGAAIDAAGLPEDGAPHETKMPPYNGSDLTTQFDPYCCDAQALFIETVLDPPVPVAVAESVNEAL